MKIWNLKLANFYKEKCDKGKVAQENHIPVNVCGYEIFTIIFLLFSRELVSIKKIYQTRKTTLLNKR